MDERAMQSESNAGEVRRAPTPKGRVLRPGESFSSFRVVRCLSSGLLADYYHMQHVRDLRDVTVGVFHPRTRDDPHCLTRLKELQQRLQNCSHESIPQIRDCLQVDGQDCIILDPVAGPHLGQYMQRHAQPDESGVGQEAATQVLALLLGVLGYAHAQGLQHCDLDSELVFVAEDGSLQILGLGVKAALGVEVFEAIVSSSVSPIGSNASAGRLNSFDIMSPEYRAGLAEDARVDVYAAGCIGYWLLTGQKAAAGSELESGALPEELRAGWHKLLAKMLEREPAKRYPSCKLVLAALPQLKHAPQSAQGSVIQRQIDRIPVPQGVLARGTLATRYYRLLLIGVVGLTLTALAASFLRFSMTPTRTYTELVATVAEPGRAPNLSLQLRPAATKVSFPGHSTSFIATDGSLALAVRPGQYTLRITAPHHRPRRVPLLIEAGQTKQLAVDLSPASTSLEVQSQPGATVSVLGRDAVEVALGVTDAAGRYAVADGLPAGRYQIVLRKPGYQDAQLEDQLLRADTLNRLEVALEALPARLTIEAEPRGAQVFVDGVAQGPVPLTIELPQPAEAYWVAVQHPGYRSERRRVQLEAGDERRVDFGALSARSGALGFEVRFVGAAEGAVAGLMEQLEVELDGRRLPWGAPELAMVEAGAHRVRLLHPLYQCAAQSVQIADRSAQRLSYQMQPLPARVVLAVVGGLAPEVRLNGVPVAVQDDAVSVPANREIELELRIADHLSMLRRFELQPNQTLHWDAEPVRIAPPAATQPWTLPYQGTQFVWVGPGDYQMGSALSEPGRLANEGPLTSVRLSRGFWVAAYEVTQAEYRRLIGLNPSALVGERLPVESVTWAEARHYCAQLNALEQAAGRLPDGYVYRLPTEAEWEYVARAGSAAPFGFGAAADPSQGNFRGVYPSAASAGAAAAGGDHYGSQAVGSYAPNAFGVFDMHGNVAEWTLDHYNGRLAGGTQVDPAPRADGSRIAVRGGSWQDFASRVRCAARDERHANSQSSAIGFRVVLAPAF